MRKELHFDPPGTRTAGRGNRLVAMSADPLDEDHLLAEGRALRALARRLVGGAGAADADDLLQEGRLAATRSGRGARSGAWLVGTLRNLARLLRRGETRRRLREQVVGREWGERTGDPAEIAAQAEVARDVAVAVEALDEPFRTVVVLRFWRGLATEVIAQQLGVPVNTVKSRLRRGLERLRERLDARHGSRGAWAGPLLVVAGGREVGAAAGAVVMSTAGVLGVLMNVKMLVGAAVTLVAAAVWLGWPAVDAGMAAPRDEVPLAAVATAGTGAPTDPGGAESQPQREVARDAVAAAKPSSPSSDPSQNLAPVPIAPWTARFLVVDEQERPVEGARVQVSVRGGPQTSAQPAAPPLHVAHTDRDGRVAIGLEGVAYEVDAAKDGIGVVESVLVAQARAARQVTTLVLRPAPVVRGVVLGVDGTPVSDAEVKTKARMTSDLWNPRAVAPVRTDASGRFTVPVQRLGNYEFVATRGGERSFSEEVLVIERSLPELTLRFPGAITVSGSVVGAAGEAVGNAEVTAWLVLAPSARDQGYRGAEVVTGRAAADGRFSLALRRHGQYQVLAAAPGAATSELVPIEPSVARPHVEVRLVLPRFATIRGIVQRDDGSPMRGLKVLATPETGLSLGGGAAAKGPVPSQVDLFPKVKAATTDDEGRFGLQVHPATTWTLSVRLVPDNWRLAVHQRGVAPGRENVVLTVGEADLAGCVVTGTVLAVPSPAEGGYKVRIVDCDAEGRATTSSEAEVQWDGNRFVCRALPRDQQFCLQIEPAQDRQSPLAPALVGPFRTDAPRLAFEVRLEAWGSLPVRVLHADGSPARLARVHVVSNQPMRWGTNPVLVDGEGAITLSRCPPGAHSLRIYDAERLLHEQDVTIISGQNAELVVRLAK